MINKDYAELKTYYVYGRGEIFYTQNLNLAKREFAKRKGIAGKGDYLALGVEYENKSSLGAVDVLIYSRGITRISEDYKYCTQGILDTLCKVVNKIKKQVG